jgi:hypothetical protein
LSPKTAKWAILPLNSGQNGRRIGPERPKLARVDQSQEVSMFDSLADRIKQDEKEGTTTMQRVLKMLTVVAIAFLLFGGLYFGVQMLEG